jgi:glutamine phosphoribosylpyrophosphate amidotransferase
LFLINGYGLVGFRDPHGIRPLVFGCRKARNTAAPTTTAEILDDEGIPMTPKNMENVSQQLDYCICSESVALDTLGFKLIRYVVSLAFFRVWQFMMAASFVSFEKDDYTQPPSPLLGQQ